ncbi:hypothetical protein EVAR_66623_1 [Eumeta japonica]|uniref:Uncharacterized protein n=1 Tax=Eumeta variegata TaxID=151549 RepID=A0A4C1ZV94_EUMVA|nr:hypothetical protein EVAR_66623_1 [Eumeta japonica]
MRLADIFLRVKQSGLLIATSTSVNEQPTSLIELITSEEEMISSGDHKIDIAEWSALLQGTSTRKDAVHLPRASSHPIDCVPVPAPQTDWGRGVKGAV